MYWIGFSDVSSTCWATSRSFGRRRRLIRRCDATYGRDATYGGLAIATLCTAVATLRMAGRSSRVRRPGRPAVLVAYPGRRAGPRIVVHAG